MSAASAQSLRPGPEQVAEARGKRQCLGCRWYNVYPDTPQRQRHGICERYPTVAYKRFVDRCGEFAPLLDEAAHGAEDVS